jgi:hypothetical protein
MNLSILSVAMVTIVVVVVMMWLTKTTPLLKDQLIPQIPPNRQTFSLSKSQAAFWFVIIFSSFLYLFVKSNSLNIITSQTVTLMGISVFTAGGGAIVDNMRDTPEDAINDALKALGLSNYQDVKTLETEIALMEALMVKGTLSVPDQAKLNGKRLLLQTFKNRTKPFETGGWFKDMTTSVNGAALHRFQALVWTTVLGVIFIYQVYQTGAMPQFGDNLLALMGISNAGYVGFKSNETPY